ncbi:unnamed protein product, partial [Onchocerca ochengi]|uniref:RNA helicase n=1 Tax=Onchocerca ochengi TaxID=42157 RepID=A0A182EUA7_ONCOC
TLKYGLLKQVNLKFQTILTVLTNNEFDELLQQSRKEGTDVLGSLRDYVPSLSAHQQKKIDHHVREIIMENRLEYEEFCSIVIKSIAVVQGRLVDVIVDFNENADYVFIEIANHKQSLDIGRTIKGHKNVCWDMKQFSKNAIELMSFRIKKNEELRVTINEYVENNEETDSIICSLRFPGRCFMFRNCLNR